VILAILSYADAAAKTFWPSLSSAIDGFKRVGLHYIAFLNTPIVKTRLPPFSTSKIAELGRSVTNFG